MSWWSHRLTSLHYFVYKSWKFHYSFVQTRKSMSPYQNISEQTLFCIDSEWSYGKFYCLIAQIWYFHHFCEQNIRKFVRRWHHQLTHLHIYIDCSRNVSMKITKVQNFTSSLFCIRFTSNFHCTIQHVLLFLWLNWNLGPDFSFNVSLIILVAKLYLSHSLCFM